MPRHGLLSQVAPNPWYPPESPDGRYDAAAYRGRTGIGRNLTIQVLEFLDREGITRFDGTRHRPVA
jgi:selenocysteine-specific elongation factor